MKLYVDGHTATYDPTIGWVCADDIIRVQLQLYTTLYTHSRGHWEPIPEDVSADILYNVSSAMMKLGYTVTMGESTTSSPTQVSD